MAPIVEGGLDDSDDAFVKSRIGTDQYDLAAKLPRFEKEVLELAFFRDAMSFLNDYRPVLQDPGWNLGWLVASDFDGVKVSEYRLELAL